MFHARRSESLIEVLVSITVIVLSTMGALSLLRASMRGNDVVGEKLQAIELAMEGIEAVKNIRDTNYLLFSSAADECWDKLNVTDPDDCSTATEIANGDYYLTRAFSGATLFQWTFTSVTSPTTQGNLRPYSVTLGASAKATVYADASTSTSGFIASGPVVFQRILTVSNKDDDSFDLTAKTSWTSKGVAHSVSLTRTIVHVY